MAIACKCDKCGKYFDSIENRYIPKIIIQKKALYGPSDGNESETYDVCLDCYIQILKLFKKERSK